jgi:hypothetical protein
MQDDGVIVHDHNAGFHRIVCPTLFIDFVNFTLPLRHAVNGCLQDYALGPLAAAFFMSRDRRMPRCQPHPAIDRHDASVSGIAPARHIKVAWRARQWTSRGFSKDF